MLGVVLAAGAGSRLGYLGGILPKTMVPVRGRPLLFYALRSLHDLGVTDARVALRTRSDLAAEYLRSLSPSTLGLRTVRRVSIDRPTRSPLETLAHALPSQWTGDLAVVLGDDLTVARGLETWRAQFERKEAWVAQGVVHEHDPAAIRRTCAVRVDGQGWIREIREKPKAPRAGLRGCGLYLWKGEQVFPMLREVRRHGPTGSLSDVVSVGVRQGKALALPIQGRNINVNTVGDLMDAWSLIPRDRGAPL